jgi:flagellar FliL protein
MSAAEEKTESAASAAPSGGGGGGSKLVLILTGVNVLATLAMIGILFVSLQKEKKAVSVADISVKTEEHGDGKADAHGGGHGEGHGEAKKEEGHGGGHGEGKEAKEEKKHVADLGKMVTLEQFTVNVSTPGSVTPKFVRVNVSLEVPNAESETELNGKMPQVRNIIIDLFNSKRPSDLATAEGRDYVKEEIRNAINGFMVSGKVKGVFFTSFNLSS